MRRDSCLSYVSMHIKNFVFNPLTYMNKKLARVLQKRMASIKASPVREALVL